MTDIVDTTPESDDELIDQIGDEEFTGLDDVGGDPVIENFIRRGGTVVQGYGVMPGEATVWFKPSQNGTEEIPLAQFSALIEFDERIDDGLPENEEDERAFQVAVWSELDHHRIDVSGREFSAVRRWTTQAIGRTAAVFPGREAHLEMAIRVLSLEAEQRVRYASTGWRDLDSDRPYFVHRTGTIGDAPGEFVVDIVGLESDGAYVLEPVVNVAEAVLASVACISVISEEHGRWRKMAPLFLGIYRSVIPMPSRAMLIVYGPTGIFKTSLLVALMRHCGRSFAERDLLGWDATVNALQRSLFHVASFPQVVDDDAPDKGLAERRRAQQALARSIGNQQGRRRMKSDTSLRTTFRPRGLVFSTGEGVPNLSASALARTVSIALQEGDIEQELLTEMQDIGSSGQLTGAMYAWIEWLMSNHHEVTEAMESKVREIRAEGRSHARYADSLGELIATAEAFGEFAVEVGALTPDQAQALVAKLTRGVYEALDEHERLTLDADPRTIFFNSLRAALAAGKAHLADPISGSRPNDPERNWGWKQNEHGSWSANGERIGFIKDTGHGERAWLLDSQAIKVVNDVLEVDGHRFPVTAETLAKQLADRGIAIRGEGRHLRPKRSVLGGRPRVLDVPLDVLIEDEDDEERGDA